MKILGWQTSFCPPPPIISIINIHNFPFCGRALRAKFYIATLREERAEKFEIFLITLAPPPPPPHPKMDRRPWTVPTLRSDPNCTSGSSLFGMGQREVSKSPIPACSITACLVSDQTTFNSFWHACLI